MSVIDSGDFTSFPRLSKGQLVYSKKDANGISQIFLYDSTVANPTPIQLTAEIDPTKTNFDPQTDGRHVAWMHSNTDGTNRQIILNGGPPFTSEETGVLSTEPAFQLQRGQLLWSDKKALRYYDGTKMMALDIVPATTFENFADHRRRGYLGGSCRRRRGGR